MNQATANKLNMLVACNPGMTPEQIRDLRIKLELADKQSQPVIVEEPKRKTLSIRKK